MSEQKSAFRRHPSRFIADADAGAGAIVAHLDDTGGQFDLLSRGTDPARITARDLLAVGMLGIPVPPAAAAWILGPEGQWLTTEILADLPPDCRLWDCESRTILRAADLFQLLRAETSALPVTDGEAAVGQATATRILATKRPGLVPLDDREIRSALKYPKNALWFRRWRDTIDDDLLSLARNARAAAAGTHPSALDLSELRVLDIVIRRRAKTRRRQSTAAST